MKHLNDDELVEGYRTSLKQEFIAEIFLRYSDAAYRTALQFTANTADAEDAVQISFIKFLRDFDQFQQGTNIKAWLMRIIVNTCKDKYREEKRRSIRQEKYGEAKEKLVKENDQAEKEELQAVVRKSVAQLPEKYRAPIWMVMYEGFTYTEVAAVLALPEKTVRTQVARGLDRLKETLGSVGSVLSIDAIMLLMKQSSLDVLPEATKKILESPELYHTIESKLLLATKSSQRFLAVKPSLFLYKFIFISSVISILVISLFYISKKQEVKTTLNTKNKTEISEDLNRVWDFSKAEDRNLPVLMGKWEWSSAFRGMLNAPKVPSLISLPIKIQEKPIFIESQIIVNGIKDDPKLGFAGFWIKGRFLQKYESFPLPQKYHLAQGNIVSQRIYIYKNYICGFIGEIPVQITKYSIDLSGANLAIFSQSYIFKKISCRTLDTPPEELLKIIESIKNQKGEIQENWEIGENGAFFQE